MLCVSLKHNVRYPSHYNVCKLRYIITDPDITKNRLGLVGVGKGNNSKGALLVGHFHFVCKRFLGRATSIYKPLFCMLVCIKVYFKPKFPNDPNLNSCSLKQASIRMHLNYHPISNRVNVSREAPLLLKFQF